MKTAVRYIVLSLISAVTAISCSRVEDEYLFARHEGLLAVDFGYDLGVLPVTRSEMAEEPVFKVTVRDIGKDVIVKTIEDHRELQTAPLVLREGKYEVRATNGTETEAAFDAPFYAGADTVDVISGETANASITCTLANVKVTVSFSDAVVDNFSRYAVTVTNENPDGTLLYEGETLGKEGYFKCTGSLVWTIGLTNTDGKEYTVSNAINDVKPRQYYNIHFDVDGDGVSGQGGTSIRVIVDNSLNEQEHNVDINLNKEPQPSVKEATGADIAEELRSPQGVNLLGLFNVSAPAGVERVVVSHSSPELVSLGIPNSINLLEVDPGIKETVNGKGLTWSEFSKGDKSLDIDFRTMFASVLPLGTYRFTINILDAQAQYVSIPVTVKIIPNIEVSMLRIDAWAKFAYVYAQYNTEEEPAGMGFQYRQGEASEWTDYAGELSKSGNTYSAMITGLDPETEYQFRAISDKDIADGKSDENIMSATTEATAQLPNFNFDAWTESGHFPNADRGSSYFWDSGNEGTSTLSKYPTSQETSHVISGSAVKMVSQYVGVGALGKFAGGNIYSGAFVKLVGMDGAEIDFGRPFSVRPTTLNGWYSYAPASINYTKSPYDNLKGTQDVAKIYVALTDWTGPFRVNNATGTLFNPDDPSVIAYGELEDNTGTGGEYRQFTINLQYRDSRRPSYVLIVVSASKYADFFTGGTGSTMYIDEFNFGFDPAE